MATGKWQVINQMLGSQKPTLLGLQEKKGKQWTLTEKGKKYGEVKPFTRNGHSGYVINWHESVLEVMK